MQIGLFQRNWGLSHQIYQDNIVYYLNNFGVIIKKFTDISKVPLGSDIIWSQGAPIFDTYRLITRSNCSIVNTIHGANQFTIPLRYLTSCKRDFLRWLLKKYLQRFFWMYAKDQFSNFITVSEYSKNIISNIYKIDKKFIKVIYHGYQTKIFNEQIRPYVSNKPYLLHISNGAPIKNIQRIINAFESLKVKNINLLLVAPLYTGKMPTNKRIKFINKRNNFIPQSVIAKLYRGAIGFIFPSLDETFGMPLLEAMACGCPIITSNQSACPEITGDAALLINPYDENEISYAINKLIDEPMTRYNMIDLGRKQRKKFSWEKSAKKHMDLFSSVLYDLN